MEVSPHWLHRLEERSLASPGRLEMPSQLSDKLAAILSQPSQPNLALSQLLVARVQYHQRLGLHRQHRQHRHPQVPCGLLGSKLMAKLTGGYYHG